MQPTPFLLRWRALPNELKLLILGFALPSDATFSPLDFSQMRSRNNITYVRKLTEPWPSRERDVAITKSQRFDAELLPLLACPEIATLATEVFYNRNIMKLSHGFSLLPPRRTRSFVRNIRVASIVTLESVGALETLADDVSVFDNLRVVTLDFKENVFWNTHRNDVVSMLQAVDTIRIPTRELIIYVQHTSFRLRDMPTCSEVDATLLPKFSVVAQNGNKPKEELYRYVFDHFDPWEKKPKRFFEVWPKEELFYRVTKKVVRA